MFLFVGNKKSATFAPRLAKRVLILRIEKDFCGNSSVGRAQPCPKRYEGRNLGEDGIPLLKYWK
ncbi:MAG: hypothetical protein J6W50_04350, partial [Bacteroidaceae bacterium]|nr:hypothetical protein [Bacteroidaceae bacterium]